MYIDFSGDNFPKTLVIRNHEEGMIWQIYHINKESEAKQLATNATINGFQAITLERYQPEFKETFPDWRETEDGNKIING